MKQSEVVQKCFHWCEPTSIIEPYSVVYLLQLPTQVSLSKTYCCAAWILQHVGCCFFAVRSFFAVDGMKFIFVTDLLHFSRTGRRMLLPGMEDLLMTDCCRSLILLYSPTVIYCLSCLSHIRVVSLSRAVVGMMS